MKMIHINKSVSKAKKLIKKTNIYTICNVAVYYFILRLIFNRQIFHLDKKGKNTAVTKHDPLFYIHKHILL